MNGLQMGMMRLWLHIPYLEQALIQCFDGAATLESCQRYRGHGELLCVLHPQRNQTVLFAATDS